MLLNLSQFKFRYLLIVCSVIILIAFFPLLAFGVRSGHDLPTHLSWFLSIRDVFSSGLAYPRWLSDQMDGMGAPTFYFYPPFTTFFSALVDVFFLGKLTPDRVLGISTFLMGALSAAAFFAWAKNYAGEKIAILAATFYAVAPYHLLCNLYTRGAIAEYAAYIWVPLIFCGIFKVLTSVEKRWIFFLALAISGIFFTHLLTAMVVGPVAFFYAILIIFYEKRSSKLDHKKILLLMLSSVLGIGMAATYFVPALSLFDQIDSSMLFQHPIEQSALFSNIDLGSISKFGTVLPLITTIYCLIGLYFVVESKIGSTYTSKLPAYFAIFWMLVAIAVTAAMAGKVMFLFQDPSPLRKMQFLWRMLSVVEFATITLFVIAIGSLQAGAAKTRVVIVGIMIFGSFFLLQNFFSYKSMGKEKNVRIELFNKDMVRYRLSPTEYFPAGTALSSEPGVIVNRLGAHLPTATVGRVERGEARVIAATKLGEHFVIQVDAREKAVISIHQFYFPGWSAIDEKGNSLTVLPVTADKFVGFEVMPGLHQITVQRTTTDAEIKGNAISATSFLLFMLSLFYFVVQWMRTRQTGIR